MSRILRRAFGLLAGVACVFAGSPRALAQSGGPDMQLISATAVGPQTIRLVVAAPSSFNQVELRPESFAVNVGGATSTAGITRDTEPVDIVLAIDTSGSMKGPAIAAARDAARGFAIRVPTGGRLGVVEFADAASLVEPLNADLARPAAALAGLDAKGETALYDGLSLAARQLGAPGRRASVVVLSDGRDTASVATIDDAVAALSAAQASVYAIALDTSEADRSALERVVASTRGVVVAATDVSALAAAYSDIAVRITNRYVIDVTSSARGKVPISVSVAQDGRVATTSEVVELAPDAKTGPRFSKGTATAAVSVATPKSTWLDRAGLPFGLSLVAVAIAGLTWLFAGSGVPQVRRASIGSRARMAAADLSPDRVVQALSGAVDRRLDRNDRRAPLDRALEDAALDMRPGEFLVALGGAAGVGALLGWMVAGVPLAALVAVVVLVVGRGYLSVRGSSRRTRFQDDLDTALVIMAGSLRAGHGLPQAIDAVARETEGPVSDEFTRVVLENRMGRDVADALRAVEARVGGGDFSWVVKAISIQRELGGDLAEVLDNVAATIRDRNRVRAQIRALSAEGRFSAGVLFSLPFVVIVGVVVFSPSYLKGFTDGLLGWLLIVGTGTLLVLGGLWMRKIVRIRF